MSDLQKRGYVERVPSSNTYTILGGTGRFAGVSGTLTETIDSTVVSATSTSVTTDDTASIRGTISY